MQEVLILGSRGVPAAHGGFETLAELLSLHLAGKGWSVSVYCQTADGGHTIVEDSWRGVRRVLIPSGGEGSAASVVFDWRCLMNARRRPGRLLILGYNTAIFNRLVHGRKDAKFINMDGLEWKRAKWPLPIRAWFWLNERIAARSGATLIADHPEIAERMRKIAPRARTVMIPYGAHRITAAPSAPLEQYGLESDRYFITICRIEPENSVLEIVRAFGARPRRCALVVLGRPEPQTSAYHRAVIQAAEAAKAANAEVLFPGAIYDPDTLASLRFHARAYCHGHQVGGTNPSLVEALGAGNAVIARDNAFNRWTAGDDQFFFSTVQDCAAHFDRLDPETGGEVLRRAREAAIRRHSDGLTWPRVLDQYEALLSDAMTQ